MRCILFVTQVLLASDARQQMTQRAYLPATYYAPCSDPYQSPAAVNKIASQACADKPSEGEVDN